MTFPITPLPSIHIDPTAGADAEAEAKQALQSLQQLIAQVGPEIIQLVVNAVLNAFGLSKIEGTVDELLTALESALSDIPQLNIHDLIADLLGGVGSALAQNIIDGIYNAITGGSSTGHTVADLLTAIEEIPASFIASILGGSSLGADIQAVIDKIVNALGLSGTGHTLADLLAKLEAIPHGNITAILGGTDLGADVQAILDNIANALGHTGTGHTLANILSFLESIPNANITNILGSSNLGADLQAVVDKIANGLGNTGTGHTLANLLSYMGGLAPVLGSASLAADVQAIVDKISNALGQSGTGHTLANLLSYLGTIPNANITNVLGSSNLGADLQAVVDKIANGLGNSGTGHTLANLLSYVGGLAPVLGSASLGADIQAVVDKIANGLGQTGTGHTLANLLTYVGGLAPVLGSASLGADVQAVVDKIANALGSSGTGHNLGNLLSVVEAIPGGNIASAIAQSIVPSLTSGWAGTVDNSRLTAILGSTNLGADLQAVVDKIANGLGNTGTGHTLANLLTYMGGLAPVLGSSTLAADLQAVVDKISNALGHTGTGHTLANLLTYFGAAGIPSANIANILGSANLGADVQAIVDKAVNALGTSGTGHTLATFLSSLGAIPNANVTNVLGSSNLGADVQATLDKLVNAWGQSGSGNTLTDLTTFANAIPNNNILSLFGNSDLGQDVQQILDSAVNAITGGAGSGNPPGALQSALSQVPQFNIVIPPNPGTGTVTHDANASQSATGSTSVLSMHWTHTAASTANVVIVRMAYYCADTFSLGGSISQGVKWASDPTGATGIPMQLISSSQSNFIYQMVWALFDPPPGAQTIFAEVAFNGQHAGTPLDVMAASSDTYIGVQSIGSVTKATGATTSMSMSLSGATGDMALNAFAAIPSTGMSSYNQTTRYNSTELDSGVEPFVLLAGDAAGASSVTFSGTAAAATAWTGVAFNLTPLLASEIGSGSYANNTSTSATACSTGKNVLPASFYTNVQLTSDLTYTATANEVTVTYAGWYSVTISILLSTPTGNFGPCLFQNGSAVQVGTVLTTTAIGAGPYQNTFTIYLSAGDTVQAGYSASSTSNKVVGEVTGTESYFSVSLMNRSVY